MRHHADSNRIKQSWHRSKYNSSFYNSEHVNRYGLTENNQRFYHVKIILKKTCNGLLEIRQITAGAGVDAAGALNDWPAGCAGHWIKGVRRIYGEEVMRLCLAYQVHWWVSTNFTLLLDDWRQSYSHTFVAPWFFVWMSLAMGKTSFWELLDLDPSLDLPQIWGERVFCSDH